MFFLINILIFLLFFPASFGLLWQTFTIDNLSSQLISFAFFLFSLEQARMAFLDLRGLFVSYQKINRQLFLIFVFVFLLTILIELYGFYLSLFSLGWGAIFVLLSQIWFNLFAPIKLNNDDKLTFHNYYFKEKISVLITDIIGLILMMLWTFNIGKLIISIVMVILTSLFLLIKYSNPLSNCQKMTQINFPRIEG